MAELRPQLLFQELFGARIYTFRQLWGIGSWNEKLHAANPTGFLAGRQSPPGLLSPEFLHEVLKKVSLVNRLPAGSQPSENFVGVFIRWKDGIEDFSDFTAFYDPRHAFNELEAAKFKGGQLERMDEFELGVTKDFKREVNAADKLLLIFGILGAGTEYLKAKGLKFPVEIAEAAGMRRAAACAGYGVPFLGDGFMGLSVARIEKNDRGPGQFGKVDESARGAWERNGRKSAARKMVARAIVLRFGKRWRQVGET